MVKGITLIGLFAALYLLLPLAALGQEAMQRAAAQGPVSLIPTDANLISTSRTTRTAEPRRESKTEPVASETSPFDRSERSDPGSSEGYTVLSRAAATTARSPHPETGASADDPTAGNPTNADILDPAVAAEIETIRNLQTMLNALGYNAGPADGLMGPRTRDAIDSFRVDKGIAPSVAEPTALLALAEPIAEARSAKPTPSTVETTAILAEAVGAADFDERRPFPDFAEPAAMRSNGEHSDKRDSVQAASLGISSSPADRPIQSTGKRPLNALDLIGRVMTNDRGMKLGEVRNLLFERDGRVAGLIVRVGGFHLLGETFASIIGEPGRNIAVPWSEVVIDWYGRVLVDMTWTDIENAPTYDSDLATAAVDM